MNFVLTVTLLALISEETFARFKDIDLNESTDEVVKRFKSERGGEYSKAEAPIREKMLRTNIGMIKALKAKLSKDGEFFDVGLNKFSDWTPQEMKSILGYKGKPSSSSIMNFVLNKSKGKSLGLTDISSIDLRQHRCSGKVLDQDQCASCYAFTLLQTLDLNECTACNRISAKSSSIQNIIDCSYNYGNNGCSGGWMPNVVNYMKDAPGVNSEASYPFAGREGFCRFNSYGAYHKQVTEYVELPVNDNTEYEMMKLIAYNMSLCVAVMASSPEFTFYSGGIYKGETACEASYVDHAVVIVGYGTSSGFPYWIVKNTWGTTWGEDGYMRLHRGSCCAGVCLAAGYPIFQCAA